MNMSPFVPYQTDSQAEMLIFNHLKQSLINTNYTAMHSVLLSHHPKKRFGEMDFVICGEKGVFVLEIKGGQVSCQNGVWHFQDKYGNTNTGGSPFHQAHTALQGLRKSLSTLIDKPLFDKICFGYGVILTDTRLPDGISGVEYDPPMLCQANQYRNLQGWLIKLFDYWQKRNQSILKSVKPLSDDDVSIIVSKIRPDFEPLPTPTPSHHTPQDISHFIQKISYQVLQPKDLSSLKQAIMDSISSFYEKFVNDTYFAPKDITIIANTLPDTQHLMSLLNDNSVCIERFDGRSFKQRKGHQISLVALDQLEVIDNKMLILVLPTACQQDTHIINTALLHSKFVLHCVYCDFL